MKRHITFAITPILLGMSVALALAEQPQQISHTNTPVRPSTVVPPKTVPMSMNTNVKVHPLLMQGQWSLVTKHYPEAVESFQKLLSMEPNNVQALNGLSIALLNQGRYDEALQFVNKAIAFDPINSRLFYTKGQILDAQDKVVEAMDAYLTFTSLSPDDGAWLSAERRVDELNKHVGPNVSQAWSHYFQGLRMLSLRQPEQAIPMFEKFKAMEPNNQQADIVLGRAYLEAGQPDKAIPCFETALKMQNNNPMAYYQLGSSYELQGEMQNAKTAFRKFVEIAPQSEMASRLNRMIEISQK